MKIVSCFLAICILSVILAPLAFGATKPTPTPHVKSKAMWQGVLGARSYNIYYKESSSKKFVHAVRRLPPDNTNFTIGSLKKGISYIYKVTALDNNGKEFWFSPEKKLPPPQL